ncbi:MAG: O-antigen ligase [Gammaproteobacteria bacterium]|jgi:O-antigen ligase
MWAWVICPIIFLFSYVPLLNLYARGAIIAFLAWFVWAATLGARRVLFPALPLWFIGWSFFALAVSLLATDMDMALRKWLTIVSVGGLSWAVANAVAWSGSVRPWAWAYIISALLAYLSNYLPFQDYVVNDYRTEVLDRYVGTLGNANTFGRSLVQAFFIGIGLLHFHAKGHQAFITILIMGGLGLGTIESSSRTAMLGLGLGVLVFYGSIKVRNMLTPLNITGLSAVVAGVVVVFAYFPKHFFTSIERMKVFFGFLGLTPDVTTKERSIEHRVDLATRAFEVWQEFPIGVGLDNFRNFVGTYAHSNFLEVAVSTGVLGLIIYYAPFILFGVREYKWRRRSGDTAWFLFCLGSLASIAAMDLFNVSYYSKTFWLFIGIICGLSAIRHTSQSAA